jgi:hypothetical protein
VTAGERMEKKTGVGVEWRFLRLHVPLRWATVGVVLGVGHGGCTSQPPKELPHEGGRRGGVSGSRGVWYRVFRRALCWRVKALPPFPHRGWDAGIVFNWLQVFRRIDATLLGSERRQPHPTRAVREETCVGL